MRLTRALALGLLLLMAACGSFDDPAIVYDLRLLGAIAEPPEVLVPTDPEDIDPSMLPEVEVCALVADPSDSRQLSYSMVACPRNDSGRCDDPEDPVIDLGSGTVEDPEESQAPVSLCARLGPSPGLLQVIERSVSLDSLSGFGAIDVQVGIEIWPAGSSRDQAIYGAKQVRFGAQLPAERVANRNPTLDSVVLTRSPASGRGQEIAMPLGRCGDIEAPVVAPGEELGFLPIESEGAREDYVVPTFDGESRSFTETLSYQFLSTDGEWSRANTGGPRDIAGNLPTLDTRWTAPDDLEDIGAGLDVQIFLIQRDERGGQSWSLSCVRVEP